MYVFVDAWHRFHFDDDCRTASTNRSKCVVLINANLVAIERTFKGTWPSICESPPAFENRFIARVYVRSITCMYQKDPFCFPELAYGKSFVACGTSSFKIDYSGYPKSFLWRHCHVISRHRHVFTRVIKVDPRCTSVVLFHRIYRNWQRHFRLLTTQHRPI